MYPEKLHLFSLNTSVELICFFIALLSLWKVKDEEWVFSVYFLLFTCLVEITGLNLRKSVPPIANQWLYNIYLPVECLYKSYMFYVFFQKYLKKHIAAVVFGIIVVAYLIELFSHGFYTYNSLTKTISSLLFVLLGFYYFLLLAKDERYHNLTSYAPFWWVSGLLLYEFGSTSANLFFHSFLQIKITSNIDLRYLIFNALNFILYGCWSYSFICRKYLKT